MLSLLFGATLALPLRDASQWRHVSFGTMRRQNDVAFTQRGIELDVKDSASPLFHAFSSPVLVKRFQVRGSTDALPPERSDDSVLRFGLAIEGRERLSWLKRLLVPKWVGELLELAPEMKFSHVEFFFLGAEARQRTKYMKEHVGGKIDRPGEFALEAALEPPLPAFGVWLQADGDDSHSAFHVIVTEATVETEISSPPPPTTSPR